MTKPVRVIQVVGGLGVGGAETWLMEVLRFWVKRGAGTMDFVLTGGKREVFDEEAERLGAKLHYIRFERAQLLMFIAGFRRVLRKGQYQAIHDHADYASGWHFLMGLGELPPVRVAHVHNPWLHIQSNYAVSPSRRVATSVGRKLVNSFASHICGTSEEILRQYGFQSGVVCRPRVEVVHCGFDVNRFNMSREDDRVRVLAEFGWPANAKLVLFAGRLDRALTLFHPQNHKNSWLALNIVREAASRDSAIRLIMAGDGPSRAALVNAVSQWGLADRLQLTGVRHDIPSLMRAADVLLFPSAQEGLGMAAVEAQAAGLPVLASNAVPKEAIVCPQLYESMSLDAPVDAWADRLLHIMERPRADIGGCRRAIESSDFSVAASARKLEAIYRSAA